MDTPYQPDPDIRGPVISLLLQWWYAEAGELGRQADRISFPEAGVAMGDLLAIFVAWVERTGQADDQGGAVSELARMMVRYAKETGAASEVSFLEFLQDQAAEPYLPDGRWSTALPLPWHLPWPQAGRLPAAPSARGRFSRPARSPEQVPD